MEGKEEGEKGGEAEGVVEGLRRGVGMAGLSGWGKGKIVAMTACIYILALDIGGIHGQGVPRFFKPVEGIIWVLSLMTLSYSGIQVNNVEESVGLIVSGCTIRSCMSVCPVPQTQFDNTQIMCTKQSDLLFLREPSHVI